MVVTVTMDDVRALLRAELAAVVSPALPRFLTAGQCARWLEVSDTAVRKWCREDGMPFVLLGKERRFEPAQVIAWMRERGQPLAELPPAAPTRHLRAVKR
jgi:excisionase family DNA binding protein